MTFRSALRPIACSILLTSSCIAANAAGASKMSVVYVSGNQVVVKDMASDLAYGYKTAAGTTVQTDAGSVPVSALKAGTVITGGLGNGTAVDDASVVSGTVVSVAPPNKAVVKVAGESREVTFSEADAAGMKVGDAVNLTLVMIRTAGDNRPLYSVKPPAMSGKLAFFQEPNLDQPDSGTNLPTYGLAGAALLAIGAALGMRRRSA